MRHLRRLARLAGFIFGLWFLTWVGILATGLLWKHDAALPEAADAIICLGGGMSYHGWEDPGPASARRALTCAELVRDGVAPVAVFTGTGNSVMSAGEAMANLAAENGLPTEAIVIEPRARSTMQNAVFSYALLPDAPDRVVIVSDPFHLPRSWIIFTLLGAAEVDVYAARMTYSYDDGPEARSYLQWTLREAFAVWANVARIGTYLAGGLFGIDPQTRAAWFEPPYDL
ncbi:YdcF family protein [Gymnodinialimonas ulvae]|uniref:YdcF family protein n=1 Tax=Gymnodinialimonas ulvae TaxID=3126504 RepID=UPI003095B3B5